MIARQIADFRVLQVRRCTLKLFRYDPIPTRFHPLLSPAIVSFFDSWDCGHISHISVPRTPTIFRHLEGPSGEEYS